MADPIRSISGVLLAVLLAVACSTSPEAVSPETVEVWTTRVEPAQLGGLIAMADTYRNDTGISITVRPVLSNDVADQLAQLVEDGTPPDLVVVTMDAFAQLSLRDLLDDQAAAATMAAMDERTFLDPAVDLLTVGGVAQAIPIDGQPVVLGYRRDLLAQAGIDPPTTLAQMLDAARALHDPSGDMAGIAMVTDAGPEGRLTVEHLGEAAGCDLLSDQGESQATSQACRDGVEGIRSLLAVSTADIDDAVEDQADVVMAYASGRAAMILAPLSALSDVARLQDGGTCPVCTGIGDDPSMSTGVVSLLQRPDASLTQGWELTSLAVVAGGQGAPTSDFITFLLGEGYPTWITTAADGNVPLRTGEVADPDRFARVWMDNRLGRGVEVDLGDRFGADVPQAVLVGVSGMNRWGFGHGDGALVMGRLQTTGTLAGFLRDILQGDDEVDLLGEIDDAITGG